MNRLRRTQRGAGRGLAAAATICLALAACAPGANPSDVPPTSGGQSTGVPRGDVTLVVWDQEVRGGQDAEVTQLNREFHAKYPNVTIKRVAKSFSDLLTTVKLAVSGPNPPDVVEANQGWGVMGQMVKAGLLLPLDGYAKSYGWDKRFSRPLLDLNSFTPDGKRFGTGSLYGLSQGGEFVGVYYSKKKLQSLGLGIPETFEEFVHALDVAKNAGETAIQFGNLDKWPGIHEFGAVQNEMVPKDQIRDFVFGRGGASFASAQNQRAASTLQEWVNKGYFTDGFNGLSYDDAWPQFTKGDGVFLISGTWLAPDMVKKMGNDLGMFLLPSPAGSTGHVATGGESLPFAITAKSEHPDAAAAYIDFMTDAHAMQVVMDNGLLPAVPVPNAPSSGVLGDVFRGWSTLNEEDGLVPYLDYSTPTFYDTITADVQELMGGKASPQQFVEKAQSDYDDFYSGP
jgi:raffinose/stachyose/melibiose transport system substrate-binding protein